MIPTPLPRPIAIDEFMPLVGQDLKVDCTPREVELTVVDVYPFKAQVLEGRVAGRPV